MTTKCGCGGVKAPPYRRARMERLPDKGRYPQGCPSSGPAGQPSPAGEGLGAGGAEPRLYRGSKTGTATKNRANHQAGSIIYSM